MKAWPAASASWGNRGVCPCAAAATAAGDWVEVAGGVGPSTWASMKHILWQEAGERATSSHSQSPDHSSNGPLGPALGKSLAQPRGSGGLLASSCWGHREGAIEAMGQAGGTALTWGLGGI